jgi:hypothetical protein
MGLLYLYLYTVEIIIVAFRRGRCIKDVPLVGVMNGVLWHNTSNARNGQLQNNVVSSVSTITNKMHYNVYDTFYSQRSHQYVSAATAAIFRVTLLQEYRGTNVVSCVAVIPKQLKIITIFVKIM